MTSRKPRTVRVDPAVWEEFEKFVVELEGTKRGYRSEHLENALKEYMDHDRHARIEEKLDRVLARLPEDETTHTHTDHEPVTKHSPARKKVDEMVRAVHQRDEPVIKTDELEKIIQNYAGADDRTIRKYKGLMRQRGLLLEHPGDPPLWTTQTDQWSQWLNQYGNLNGPGAVDEFLDDYPALLHSTPDGFNIEMEDLEA